MANTILKQPSHRRMHGLLSHTIILFLALCLMPVMASAQGFPALTGRVVDQAGLLSVEQETALDQTLSAHETETSNQIVVVTIADLQGYDIADYANRLGRAWGVGTAEQDNGVVLLVAPNARKVRIEVGYGLEGALTDSLSSVIIQREILPAFRDNDYPGGISRGVNAIISAIRGEYTAPAGSGRSELSDSVGQFIPLIFIAMVGIPELLRRSGHRLIAHSAFPAGFTGLFATLASGQILIGIAAAIAIFFLVYFNSKKKGLRASKNGERASGYGYGGVHGGGGSGGGFSGGGGSFGGGGASGSW